jgi:hypothetical protein
MDVHDMKPSRPYRSCSCRDPLTGRLLGKSCPNSAGKGTGTPSTTSHGEVLVVKLSTRTKAQLDSLRTRCLERWRPSPRDLLLPRQHAFCYARE